MPHSSPYQAPAIAETPPQERHPRATFWKRAIWVSVIMIIVPPMIGLIGTVIGMTRAFGELKHTGDADPSVLAGDISVALLTTLYGSVLSVIGLVCLIVSIIRFRSFRRTTRAVTQ